MDVCNSFEMRFNQGEDGWQIDHPFLLKKQEQCKPRSSICDSSRSSYNISLCMFGFAKSWHRYMYLLYLHVFMCCSRALSSFRDF